MKKLLSFGVFLSLSFWGFSVLAQTEPVEEKAKTVVIPNVAPKNEDILKGLDYPELQVVPRATERLAMEAQNERRYGWTSFWPYQVSSIATLLAGNRLRGNYKNTDLTAQEKKDSDNIALGSMVVGAGGLGLSIFLISRDMYGEPYRRIKAMKVTDRRSELLRERMAEEALEEPADLVDMLTTVSVSLNLLSNVAIASQSNDDVRSYAIAGIIASFLPRMFTNRYVDNWTKQQQYKRKIYTPLIGMNWIYSSEDREFNPQLSAYWSF